MTHGCHGTAGYVRFSHFDKFPDAVAYLRDVKGATITGVEITLDAKPAAQASIQGHNVLSDGQRGPRAWQTPRWRAAATLCIFRSTRTRPHRSTSTRRAPSSFTILPSGRALPEAARGGYKFTQGPTPQSTPHSGMGLKQMRTLNADGSVAAKKGRMACRRRRRRRRRRNGRGRDGSRPV